MEALFSAFGLFIFSSLIFSNVDCEVFLEINDIIPITTNVSANNFEDECGADEACVRFCCEDSSSCSDLDFVNKSSIAEAEDLDENFRILKGLPSCYHTVSAYEIGSNWSFLKNGSIKEVHEGRYFVETPDRYCYGYEGSRKVMICFDEGEEETQEETNQRTNFFPYLMLISVPFCVVTFFVYLCIPDLRNLHGKCLMGYLFGMTCLFLSFPLVGLNQEFIAESSWFCQFTGYIAYVSILFCFFWLNVMCYDIYSTFRSIQGSSSVRRTWGIRNTDNRRFLCYCLYAFGVPCIVSLLVFVLDNYADFENMSKVGMGQERCWIKKDRAVERNYVYLPMGCLLLLNLAFYLITSYKIYVVQKQTSSVIRADNTSHHSRINVEKRRFFLYLRLFVIMGVPWILEIMSWYWHGSWFSHVADVLNSLQGMIIFFLFVWKQKIRKCIMKKFFQSRVVSIEPTNGHKGLSRETSAFRTDSSALSRTTCDSSYEFTEIELAVK